MENQNLLKVLKNVFGYSSFNPHQQETIEQFLQKRDCFVNLRTGGGKSLCFVMPALLTNKPMIVVSPLISLMHDQCNKNLALGIAAEILSPQTNQYQLYDRLRDGKIQVLYVTPEKLEHWDKELRILCKTDSIAGIAIDEAHCVSTWGHDFRTSYRKLSMLKDYIGDNKIPIMALTATATTVVQQDIIDTLKLKDPFKAVGSFDRPNLTLLCENKESRKSFHQIKAGIIKHASHYNEQTKTTTYQPCIVYCRTVKLTHAVNNYLIEQGFASCCYNAKMAEEDKENSHTKFSQNHAQIMVATIAYGMGIDHPSVRLIIHFGVPQSVENYYQEAGRAGRDGLPSVCLLYWREDDFTLSKIFLSDLEGHALKVGQANLEFMTTYCYSTECRRKLILERFGEIYPHEKCTSCDNCCVKDPTVLLAKNEARRRGLVDITEPAQTLLECFKELRGASRTTVLDVLLGKSKKNAKNFSGYKCFGSGVKYKKSLAWWTELIHVMMAKDALIETLHKSNKGGGGRGITYSIFTVNTKTVLELPLIVRMDNEPMVISKDGAITKTEADKRAREANSSKNSAVQAELLLTHLNILTQEIATQKNLGLHHVCSTKSLEQMALLKPHTLIELSNLDGWGHERLATYGQTYCDAIKKYCEDYLAAANENQFSNSPGGCDLIEESASPKKRTFLEANSWDVEYAKTGRATCVGCEKLIEQNSVKIVKLEGIKKFQRSFHLKCSIPHAREYGGLNLVYENVGGIKKLKVEDQALVKDAIPE